MQGLSLEDLFVGQRSELAHTVAKTEDAVIARVEVAAIYPSRARVTLATACLMKGKVVVDGETESPAAKRGA